jgi:hypothetical protein
VHALQIVLVYSRKQKKLGQCFFANVNLLALSMVTMKILIYIIVTPVYSTQLWLDLLFLSATVFYETGSVTHKKGAGRPIVRTEEIITLSKLRRTFSIHERP